MGFLGKTSLLPEFANVAFNLKDPKKISQIVQTEYGYHIIQLIEKRGDRINCRPYLVEAESFGQGVERVYDTYGFVV